MISATHLTDYVTTLFVHMGCPYDDARAVAEVLVAAELRGISSHGVARVHDYYMLRAAGRVNVTPNIQLVYQSPSTATVDGDNSFGPVVARRSMELAIEKARNAGTGWVAVRRSNHFGISAFYSMMALENDMVGIVLTNTPPQVAPVFGTAKMLGTNPISVAIPALRNPPLVFDFATAPLEPSFLARLAQEGKRVPLGLVQDALGNPTDDPSTVERGGAILPLGGSPERGSHKGFCISALVDIFSSFFSGASFATFVPPEVAHLPMLVSAVGQGVGHFFGAMRIDAFRAAAEFKGAVDEWIDTFRNAKGIDGSSGVLIPDEKQRIELAVRSKSGIPLSDEVIKSVNRVAASLDCPPLPYLQD